MFWRQDSAIFVSLRNHLINTWDDPSGVSCLHCDEKRQKDKTQGELRVETLRMTGKAGRKERKGGKWVRDGGVALAQSKSLRFECVSLQECVSPIECCVYKSESRAVCVLQGRCFLQCNLSLWWNVWTTSDSTPLEPPTHSISHCKQPGFARVSETGQVESLWTPPKITEYRKCFKIKAHQVEWSANASPGGWYQTVTFINSVFL